MNEQLSFFETPRPSGPDYNLILATFPDDYTAQQIIELGNSIRKMHGLRGKLRPVTHLHVSLPIPGQAMHPPETVIERIGRACKVVTPIISPFEIKFDRVMSFRGRTGNRAVVLLKNNHESDGIMCLYRLLCAEFAKLGFAASATPKFEPHLTILYDQQELTAKSITPVCWLVREIVLVLSEVGATKYHRLGCWALGE
jgi:RNA 2',3'-cyclic 3'-phosphodiesterase